MSIHGNAKTYCPACMRDYTSETVNEKIDQLITENARLRNQVRELLQAMAGTRDE